MAPSASKRGRSSAKPDADAEPQAGPAAGIDTVLDGLEGVVKELESGDLPLERALARFEEGVRLARQGGKLLDGVEERVERLLADRDETVPLDGATADDDEEDIP